MSYPSLGVCAALALGSWISLTTALAETRHALVIGNSAYQTVPALPNPANDAKAITEFLKSAGFEVTSVHNLTLARHAPGDQPVRRLRSPARGADAVAAVYYAGHGLQVDGENFLVPIDASIVREADVPLQALRLVDLMNALAAIPSKSRIVMLDACRNNPFSEINKVTGRGLAIVDAPPGTIISYATSPGSEALDGDGSNSPYTTAILAAAKEPGLPVEQAFKRVRFAVNSATNKQQLPWESSSLTSDFSFFPGPSDTPQVTQARPSDRTPGAARVEPLGGRLEDASCSAGRRAEAYELVIREDSVEAYQAYLALFPASPTARGCAQYLRSAPRHDRLVHRRDDRHAGILSGVPGELRRHGSCGDGAAPAGAGEQPLPAADACQHLPLRAAGAARTDPAESRAPASARRRKAAAPTKKKENGQEGKREAGEADGARGRSGTRRSATASLRAADHADRNRHRNRHRGLAAADSAAGVAWEAAATAADAAGVGGGVRQPVPTGCSFLSAPTEPKRYSGPPETTSAAS